MKSKCMGITLIASLFISSLGAQEMMNTHQKKSQIQAVDKAIKGLKHLQACLEGKEVCSKIDFAVLGASLLFVYGVMTGLRNRILAPEYITPQGLPGEWKPWKKNLYTTSQVVNPVYWGNEIFYKRPPTKLPPPTK